MVTVTVPVSASVPSDRVYSKLSVPVKSASGV
jgi:hypothetical protein